jgi:quercetin dioxygenase-like cupin family protein
LNLEIERWNESDPPDGQILRQRMEAEGYSVFESRDAAGTTYGPHTHAEDQSHWILSGALILRVGWEEYTLRAGDRDYLPANTEHSAIVPRDEAVVYLIGIKY